MRDALLWVPVIAIGASLAACTPSLEYCADTCSSAGDGVCDDGRDAAGACALGTDCTDCGPYAPAEASSPYRITGTTGAPVETSAPREETCVPSTGTACAEWSCSGSRSLTQAGGGFTPECEGGVGMGCSAFTVGCPTVPSDSSAFWECRDGASGVGCYFAGGDTYVSGGQVTYCTEYGVCENGVPVQRCVRIPSFWRPDNLSTDLFFNPSLCSTWFEIGDWRKDCGSCNDACNLSVEEAEGPCAGADECGGCPDGSSCVDGLCIGEGALRFTLQWSADNDLDLYVTTPGGSTISYSNRSADGGMLDQDDTNGGSGSVENVFFTSPLSGTYTYWVDNFSGSAASFNLSAYKAGRRADMRGGSVESGGESAHYTIDYP